MANLLTRTLTRGLLHKREVSQETFHGGVIETIVGMAETHIDTCLVKQRPILGAGVLRASIG